MCRDTTECKEALFGSDGYLLLFKFLSTLTGGLRFDDDEGECGESLPIILQIVSYALQILIPSLLFVFTHDEIEFLHFILIYCGVFFIGSFPLTIIAYRAHGRNQEQSCLIDHIKCLPEIRTKCDLFFGLAFAVISAASQASLAWDDFSLGFGLMILTPFLMNCFFGHPPAESALYNCENSRLGIYSTKYSRPFYLWILALLNLLLPYNLLFLTLALILPLIFALGALSSPFVTLFHLIEQIQIHFFGSTARVNDLRLIISFLSHSCSIALIFVIANSLGGWDSYDDTNVFSYQLVCINCFSFLLAYFFSLNFTFSCSLLLNKKEAQLPKNQGVNVLVQQQHNFSSSTPLYKLLKETITSDLWIFLGGLIVSAFISFFSESINISYNQSLKVALILLSSILCCSFWIINTLLTASHQLFLIACCKSTSRLHSHPPTRRTIIAIKRIQEIALVALYTLLSLLHFDDALGFATRLDLLLYCFFSLHYFLFLLRNLYTATILLFIAGLTYLLRSQVRSISFPLFLIIIHFIYQRVSIFIKKFHSYFVVILANCCQGMDKNTYGLYHLLLIPFSLLVICLSTLFDTPSFFYLGSPTLVFGFPRPQRLWSHFKKILNSDSPIQSLIYVGLMPSFINSLRIQLRKDVSNFQEREHYLGLNGDHTILLSIFKNRQIFTRDFERNILRSFLLLLSDNYERLWQRYKNYNSWDFDQSRLKKLQFFYLYFPFPLRPGLTKNSKVKQRGSLPERLDQARVSSMVDSLEIQRKKLMPLCTSAAELEDISLIEEVSSEEEKSEQDKEKEVVTDERMKFIMSFLFSCFPSLLSHEESMFDDLYQLYSHKKYHPFFLDSMELKQEVLLMLNQAIISSYYRIYINMIDSDPEDGKEVLNELQGIEVLSYNDFIAAEFNVLDLTTITFSTVDYSRLEIKQLREKDFELEMLKLREEVVRNIWSNVAFELMYLGIDDEERRTIQENPLLIQNILSSLAENPLGYGVFSSGPILIHF